MMAQGSYNFKQKLILIIYSLSSVSISWIIHSSNGHRSEFNNLIWENDSVDHEAEGYAYNGA